MHADFPQSSEALVSTSSELLWIRLMQLVQEGDIKEKTKKAGKPKPKPQDALIKL